MLTSLDLTTNIEKEISKENHQVQHEFLCLLRDQDSIGFDEFLIQANHFRLDGGYRTILLSESEVGAEIVSALLV